MRGRTELRFQKVKKLPQNHLWLVTLDCFVTCEHQLFCVCVKVKPPNNTHRAFGCTPHLALVYTSCPSKKTCNRTTHEVKRSRVRVFDPHKFSNSFINGRSSAHTGQRLQKQKNLVKIKVGRGGGGGQASPGPRPSQHTVPRVRLPPIRLHPLQRALAGHAPQRNKQRERRRYQHNRQLELGRVDEP